MKIYNVHHEYYNLEDWSKGFCKHSLAITCMHYVLEYRVEYTKIENSYFIL